MHDLLRKLVIWLMGYDAKVDEERSIRTERIRQEAIATRKDAEAIEQTARRIHRRSVESYRRLSHKER